MRKKIDIRKIAFSLTPQELKEFEEQGRIKMMLGIYETYNERRCTLSTYIPSMYNSRIAYENDKELAEDYILENKSVPQDLQNRLIAARIELENLGLLEPYTE